MLLDLTDIPKNIITYRKIELFQNLLNYFYVIYVSLFLPNIPHSLLNNRYWGQEQILCSTCYKISQRNITVLSIQGDIYISTI